MKKKILSLMLASAMALAIVPGWASRAWADTVEPADETEGIQVPIDSDNFPDNNFRAYVKGAFDTKTPVDVLTQDELDAAKGIYVGGTYMMSLKGIEYFPNIERLECEENFLEELDLSHNTKLTHVDCWDNPLTSINLQGCTNLEYLDCSTTLLTELDLSGYANLFEIDCCDSTIEKLNLSGCEKLEVVDCEASALTELDLSGLINLVNVDAEDSAIQKLNLSGCENMDVLDCEGCQIQDLNLTGCKSLETVYISYCGNLTKVDFSDCKALIDIHAQCSPALEEMILGSHPRLTYINCTDDSLKALNVTGCPKLEELRCSNNKLSELKLNRNPEIYDLRVDNNPMAKIVVYGNPYILQLIAKYAYTTYARTPYMASAEIKCYAHEGELELADGSKVTGRFTYGFGGKVYDISLTFNITMSSDGNGTASASVDEAVEDTVVTITATPNDGYQFKEWQVVSGNVTIADPKSATTTFEMPFDNVEIKAVFEKGPRTIKLTVEGYGSANSSTASAVPGTTVTINATPNEGYVFQEWQVISGGVTIAEPKKASTTFVVGEENVEIKAIFKEPSFEDFVERLYTVALGRDSEPEGKAFWVDQVVNKGATGADCARFFMLGAPEFLNRNLSDSEFVEVLYKTYFDRDSEPDGKAYWMGRLAAGESRAVLVEEFIESVEWCNVCATYGVKSGALYHKATIPSKNAVKFATRLYTCCLGRDPEAEGLQYWALALTNLDATGYQAASLFFTLPEFVGLKTTDEEYVTRLYRTFMGREPEGDGYTYWIGLLKGGTDRNDVMKAFAGCPEFQEICNHYGIVRGDI